MIAMAVAMGIGRFVYTPLLPAMMDQLRLSASQAGLIAAANFLGYLIGAVVASGGWAQGRERATMLWALAANAALAAAMGTTEHLAVFLLIRFLAGIASAFVLIFVITIVFGHLAVAGRNSLQSLHFAGVGLGIALAAVMTASLEWAGGSWHDGWLGAGLLSAAGLVAAWILIDRGPLSGASVGRESTLPRSPALAKIILAYGLFGFGYVITATFIVAIVRQGDGGRLFESQVWLVTGLAAIPSVYLWNHVVVRLGLTRTFALTCLLEAVGVLASVGLGSFLGPLLGGALLGATFVSITAIGLQLARSLAPTAPRRAVALMTAAFGTGQILGPIAAGYMADHTGSFVAPSIIAAATLLLSATIAYDSGR
ncbi:YbfB/YjiJ family MFS transporter [Mesorhizobium sp. NBSH29]|nr:YbfB/YjiJ family MFS transporter [Mesorhizobium sp. NBSH29]